MELCQFPTEVLKNICSFLGGDAYQANMVPYLRSCVDRPSRRNFLVEVYERGDFALIYLYDLFPTYDLVEECVSAAVKREDMTLLSWLLARSNNKLLLMIGQKAAVQGSYLVLTWSLHQGLIVNTNMVRDVIMSGNVQLYKLLFFLGYAGKDGEQETAALHGQFSMLMEAKEASRVCFFLAQGGHLQALQSFHNAGILDKEQALRGAFSSLNKDIILWLKDESNLSHVHYLSAVLSSTKSIEEKLDFLEFLDTLTTLDYNYIASNSRHMKFVDWCLSRGQITRDIFSAACSSSVQDMERLCSLGYYRPSGDLYHVALQNRKVENLEWLLKKGCPLPARLIYSAITRESEESPIPCLEWCLKQGMSLPGRLVEDCIRYNEMGTLVWLLYKLDKVPNYIRSCIAQANLEAFNLLLPYDRDGISRNEITYYKQTCPNYLLYEEMEKLLY
ncbi:Ankyrin repeat-containing protein [Brazilian cedratvirus IHUMI]|uniref:Ankyrin repeat-containing protein n=1 Tax=Brazilian cedratvirus IHUMI TaxID=2126980 RepID=A0A2R8FD16_9VIRU|nr:Ankyrin repeat-containing protein [Brazilian cedratvirus IHUMI]